MIGLQNVCKDYHTRQGRRRVLHDINLRVAPGEKIGILGRNGAGKSTMIRMISGAELPTSGRIVREMSVSWPLAFGGAFQGSLTGMDNLRFICRIYGADAEAADTAKAVIGRLDPWVDFVNVQSAVTPRVNNIGSMNTHRKPMLWRP